jgi:hypothetical protein
MTLVFVKLKHTDSDSMKFKSRLMLNIDFRSSCKWAKTSLYFDMHLSIDNVIKKRN